MPLLGFGTFQLSGGDAENSVREALKAGYRHVESSVAYGNEDGTGRGIKSSGVKREDIFVTTKVTPIGRPDAYNMTIAIFKKQLNDLGLDYLDMYLIHAPLSAYRMEMWRALVSLKKNGLVRHIGVSNYGVETLEEIRVSGLPMPEINEIEFHPLCQEKGVDAYMEEHGIEKLAYSSLVPLSTWRKAGEGIAELSAQKEACGKVVDEIARQRGIAATHVLLRYGLQKGYGVLARSRNPEHIRENMNIFDFELTDEEMARLDAFDTNRLFAWASSGINPMYDFPPWQEYKKVTNN